MFLAGQFGFSLDVDFSWLGLVFGYLDFLRFWFSYRSNGLKKNKKKKLNDIGFLFQFFNGIGYFLQVYLSISD